MKQEKSNLRKVAKEIRKNIGEKKEKSAKIIDKLESLEKFKKAKKILIYYSADEEVSTIQLIENAINKKELSLPRTEDKHLVLHSLRSTEELKKGRLNILEPSLNAPVVDPSTLELAIIPGLAFDKGGSRLGFGQGYYDRLLSEVVCPKIALAYDAQILKDVPREDHDQIVDIIITEKEIIYTNNNHN